MDNESWIYINGELYHSGKKGMKWGKHLPGTDWWKNTSGSRGTKNVRVKNSSPYVSKEYQQEVEFNSQQNKYPTEQIERISQKSNSNRKRPQSKVEQAANKVASNKSVFDTGNKRDNVQKRKKDPSFKERVSAKVKAYGASVKVAAKSLVRNIKNRASYGAYKAEKYIRKIANSTISSIKKTVNKYKPKVDSFLKKVGIVPHVKPYSSSKRTGGGSAAYSHQVQTKK